MHSSKKEQSSSSQNSSHIPNSDSNSHIVSSLSQLGIPSKFQTLWILDSGASNNFCPYIHLFSSIQRIDPISSKFPNGSTILAHFLGTTCFTQNLYLSDVLYIPQFQFILVCVYKLTKSLNCKITFSHDFCGIQDPYTQKTIGRVELHTNLYILNQEPRIIPAVILFVLIILTVL